MFLKNVFDQTAALCLKLILTPNVLCRHDSYGNQYPGQGAPPGGSYPNQQPGMFPQQQTVSDYINSAVSYVVNF